jgi:hypothetical protein
VSDGPAAADHLSLDELAELEEGIAANADALRGHLDGCEACRRRAGQLRASRALLSALPTDPMPNAVAARIDAALAAEAAPGRTFTPGGDIVPLRGRRGWWRGPNLAAVAAGVAVLALGAALIVGHTRGNSPSTSAAKAAHPNRAPAAGVSSGLKQWRTGHDYTEATRAGYVTGIVIAAPPPLPPAPAAPSPVVGAVASPSATTTAASYSAAALRQAATVFACANLLAHHPVQPLAVDYARYEGVPAVILVLPGLQHPATQLSVYVIRTTCSENAADLSYFFVPRP